jgi:hypothetical protein
MKRLLLLLFVAACLPLWADSFSFTTGAPNGLMAVASRPDSVGKFEIEAADDFVTTAQTHITSATFYGLITGTTPVIGEVTVEIYRVFPKDSDSVRTPNVPTRANSPSDVAFASKDSVAGLTFGTSILSTSFTAGNSVQPGGIHPFPNQTTGGDGPLTGQEVLFTVNFVTPFDLPSDHYFFVPQVEVTGGEFYWLSGARPVVMPGGATDLQMWTRDANLDPDWLRVGTDIVGGGPPPTFNGAFSLNGETLADTTVPEPTSMVLMLSGLAGVWGRRRR